MMGSGQPSWNSVGYSVGKYELHNVPPPGNAYEGCLLHTWLCSTVAGNGLEILEWLVSRESCPHDGDVCGWGYPMAGSMASSQVSVCDPGGTVSNQAFLVYRQKASDLALSALLGAELSVFAVLDCPRVCLQDKYFQAVVRSRLLWWL